MTKAAYKAAVPPLRQALVNAQYQLKDLPFAVIILLAGRDRIGIEQLIDRLQEWMDARYIDTWFAGPPTEEERSHPWFWRFWRAMPPHGRVGLFAGGWVNQTITALLRGTIDDEERRQRVRHFNCLDALLDADGSLVLKIWLDLPEKAMKKRLAEAADDPDQARYVEDQDREIVRHYAAATPIIETLLEDSSSHTPWLRIDGRQERSRDLSVARHILQSIQARLERQEADNDAPLPEGAAAIHPVVDHLAKVDLQARLPYDRYRRRLDRLQLQLHELSLQARDQGLGSVLAFEGWDAAGKGGAIRRITQAISARDCKVIPIAAPTDEELAHPYLWRFWRRLPADGQMRIFDRSWYGRVLVERAEGLATPVQWQRAYEEINDFEAQLVTHGTLVMKFWLHIDADEQLRRFRAREQTGYKKYKITSDDYRNRSRWPAYTAAVNEMVERTDNDSAPWLLVAANDKRHARVTILSAICQAMESRLQ